MKRKEHTFVIVRFVQSPWHDFKSLVSTIPPRRHMNILAEKVVYFFENVQIIILFNSNCKSYFFQFYFNCQLSANYAGLEKLNTLPIDAANGFELIEGKCPYVSAVIAIVLCPAYSDTSFISKPFMIKSDKQVCLSSCSFNLGKPAFSVNNGNLCVKQLGLIIFP